MGSAVGNRDSSRDPGFRAARGLLFDWNAEQLVSYTVGMGDEHRGCRVVVEAGNLLQYDHLAVGPFVRLDRRDCVLAGRATEGKLLAQLAAAADYSRRLRIVVHFVFQREHGLELHFSNELRRRNQLGHLCVALLLLLERAEHHERRFLVQASYCGWRCNIKCIFYFL